jgi:hypothetical protein
VAPVAARWPDLLNKKFGADLPDFAIVRFKAPDGQPLVPNAAAVQCVRSTPLGRGEPLYVVGYPQGNPVTVHDSARVYLPFRELDGDRFLQLRIDVEAQTVDGITWRFFRSVVDNFQPRMGIVADTFRGNSGGPVFDHEREQCVAGILISGSPDTGVRRTPNWREHERVEPTLQPLLTSITEKN